ncbi:MAG: hypothetical protein NTY51_11780 [Deltaproteobacteria bacterium]|nr:hypothetical protein [Deltaproteobacteria bacterium]
MIKQESENLEIRLQHIWGQISISGPERIQKGDNKLKTSGGESWQDFPVGMAPSLERHAPDPACNATSQATWAPLWYQPITSGSGAVNLEEVVRVCIRKRLNVARRSGPPWSWWMTI